MEQELRSALEDDLKPFMAANNLRAVWHRDDRLLRMEATEGSGNAPICVNFDSGFWSEYALRDRDIQSDARCNLVTALTSRYRPDSTAQIAQQITAGLDIL